MYIVPSGQSSCDNGLDVVVSCSFSGFLFGLIFSLFGRFFLPVSFVVNRGLYVPSIHLEW